MVIERERIEYSETVRLKMGKDAGVGVGVSVGVSIEWEVNAN